MAPKRLIYNVFSTFSVEIVNKNWIWQIDTTYCDFFVCDNFLVK